MNAHEVLDAVTRQMGGDGLRINSGECCYWAAEVCRLIPEAYSEWGCDVDPKLDAIGCHCYVIISGRYYDAEAIDGVSRPHDLPFYKRAVEVAA